MPLLDARGDAGGEEGDRVDGDFDGQLEFLFASERGCVGDVADVEVGEDAEDALFYFGADLLLGEILLSDGVDGGFYGLDAQDDGR